MKSPGDEHADPAGGRLTFARRASRLVDLMAGLILLALAVVVLLQVLSRYVLRAPIDWTIDGATMLLIWLSFLGAAAAASTRSHFAMEFVMESLPAHAQRLLSIVADLIVILVLAALAYAGARFALLQMDQTYPSAGLPKGWAALAIPVSAFLMIPHYLIDALRRLGISF